MTLRTSLIIDGDSESGKRALAGMEQAIDRAEAQAKALAAAFGAADVATTRLAQAQTQAKAATDAAKASYAAGEIELEEYNRQLLEIKTSLGLVAADHGKSVSALRAAQTEYDTAVGGGQRYVRSLGEQRIGAQQLAMNLNDMATMFALGARPQQIFASQGAQVVQSLSLMNAGSKGLLGLLGNPWVMGFASAAIAVVPLISNLLDEADAAEKVEFATDKLGDAQGILGQVMDLTTGKIKTQSEALWNLARAQAAAGEAEARRDKASAQRDMADIQRYHANLSGGFGGGLSLTRSRGAEADIVEAFSQHSLSETEAMRGLRSLGKTGIINDDAMTKAMSAISNLAMADVNIKRFTDLQDVLDGKKGAVGQFLKPGTPKKDRQQKQGPSEAEVASSVADERAGFMQQYNSALASMAKSADEQAEYELRNIELTRIRTEAHIKGNKDYTDQQKQQLIAASEEATEAEREALDFKRRQRLEQEAQALADQQYQQKAAALQLQLQLADTEGQRKKIALQLLAAEQEHLKAKYQEILASQTAGDAEKQRAANDLADLQKNAGLQMAAAARANETSLDTYLRELNQTPEQLNEAFGKIKIDGLKSLNDELADAIMGAKSLGEAFHNVAQQILADLVKIAIQQAIIKPLANALLGGGGGGGLGGLLGGLLGGGGGGALASTSMFAGSDFSAFSTPMFADGTDFAPGGFAIVGERGPEVVNLPRGSQVVPNHELKSMILPARSAMSSGIQSAGASSPTQVSLEISNDFRGAAPEAVGELRARIDQLQRELPGTILSTMQDAKARFIWRGK